MHPGGHDGRQILDTGHHQLPVKKSRQATSIGWRRGSNESLYGILGTRGGGSRATDIDTAPQALLVQTDAGIFRCHPGSVRQHAASGVSSPQERSNGRRPSPGANFVLWIERHSCLSAAVVAARHGQKTSL